ncbi:hypothetical protein SteCoe_27772 [Stentor coeruleus]|uniref:Adenylate kinase n=1 Tax=Stentor coeruleus TaxID=5963 RepID=A0A1R2B9P1_9CILI|nr:hypothetical protein SteCoe_27772 [Stentor coeruleus]
MANEDLRNIPSAYLFEEVMRRYKCNFRPLGSAVFIGPRYAGKTTQAEKLAEFNCWCHIEPNELIKEHISKNTQIGKFANDQIDKGKSIEDNLIVQAVVSRIKEPMCSHGAVFDGFPLNKNQAEIFDSEIGKFNVSIDRIVSFEATDSTLVKRANKSLDPDSKYAGLLSLETSDKYNDKVADVIKHYKNKKNVIKMNTIEGERAVWTRLRNLFSKNDPDNK